MDEKKRWRLGCLIILVLFVIGLALIIVMGVFSGFSKEPGGSLVFGGDQIAVVRVNDVIMSSEKIVENLMDLKQEDAIKAVVLHINSPGGGVAASQEIYEGVLDLRAGGKKVVASLSSVAASGAYYIACAADTIVANPGTLTGSIGVILQFPYFQELFKKIGVDVQVVKSGKFKDAGSGHRKMTQEERALFQDLINDAWMQFVEAVAEGRDMEIDSVKALADGRIFTGRQAMERGLVDILGTFEEAKLVAKDMAGLPEDAGVYEFRKKRRLKEWILDDFEGILGLRRKITPSGLNYLYMQ